MPADKNPPPPSEEFPIDYLSDAPLGSRSAGTPPTSRGKLPPPVSGDRGFGKPNTGRASDFWALIGCNAIVFGASVCIMVVELTASRLIATYVGSSLYTWTSVIGVVLAGISMGNYLGGWLADRFPPQKLLSWLFLASGLLTLSILFLNNMAAETQRPEGINWQLWVMTVVAWVFFLPALSLGTISPVTASMALKRSAKTGITVGNIYAWGALGSIMGTFLTGFWLIGEFGSRQVIWMTAAALVIMGFLVAAGQRAFRVFVVFGALQLIVLVGVFSSTTADQMSHAARGVAGIRSGWRTGQAGFDADRESLRIADEKKDEAARQAANDRNTWRWERLHAEEEWAKWGEKLGGQLHEVGRTLALRRDDPNDYIDESDYFTIKISNSYEHGDRVKVLTLDHLIHSYWNPDRPTKLYYDYEQVYAAITERAAAMPQRSTEVTLERLPAADLAESFPKLIAYDPASKTLSVRGTMQLHHLRKLLSIGRNAELGEALFSTWEQALNNWNRASQGGGGVILTELRQLPEGIKFPEELALKVHYDSVLKSLVCTGSFTLADVVDLLAQGEMREFVKSVWELFKSSRKVSTLFIGGGGFVFPRWIEQAFPQEPLIDVAEIDPAVKTAIEKKLGLPTEYGPPSEGKTYVRTHVGDARKFVDEQIRANKKLAAAGKPPVTYNFVYGDAFNDLSVPWHLTTREFSQRIRSLLTPEAGVYLVNIIDIYPRVQYPTRFDAVGLVTYTGEFPSSLLPAALSSGQWLPCSKPYADLEVSRNSPSYSVRYKGVMSKDRRDSLMQLGRGGSEKGPAGTAFADAIGQLYEQTNSVLIANPPKAFVPVNSKALTWQMAPAPYGRLQLSRHHDDYYTLGFRGVMDDRTRNELISQAGNDDKLKRAIEALYKRSHQEKVGQFLGRYVSTAREVFPYVYLFTSNEGEPGASRDTFVVACSLQKINFENLGFSGDFWHTGPFAWTERDSADEKQKLDFGEMPAILELARNKLLVDNFAPVDNLLAPVFVDRDSGDD